jgi:hypothetical protein
MLNAKAVRRHDGSRVHLAEHPGGGLPCTPYDIRLVSISLSKVISLSEKADTRHKIHSVYSVRTSAGLDCQEVIWS